MTSQKILEVIDIYKKEFEKREIKKIKYPHKEILSDKKLGLEHCHGMLDQMIEFVEEGRIEKTFRWLGFIQGVLWAEGIYSLEDLKNHNKPEEIH